MRMVDLIEKKKNGQELTREEIRFLIKGYVAEDIPDYQVSAWAMAVIFQGMKDTETAELTQAMVESGEQLDLSAVNRKCIDKHSTGGVGDKTTLLLAPMVAACGVPVAKMSGRGLGHTGGTIDKLSSIPGFKVELSKEEFITQVKKIGLAVISQTGNLVPADKKLYGLRDVTATVNSIPLIASSVMSKKIAAGSAGIVLDVKYGSGAFMDTLDKARTLAETMVKIGNNLGRQTVAVLSSMDQPLGWAVGNSLEVLEVIDALQGQGPEDLMSVCYELGAWMLKLGGAAEGIDQGKILLEEAVTTGKALEKFVEFVKAQGGDTQALLAKNLPVASNSIDYVAEGSGFIQKVDARTVGVLSMVLGAGRITKDSSIDLGAGVLVLKKSGERVEAGESILRMYTSDKTKFEEAKRIAYQAIEIAPESPVLLNTIQEVVS